MFARKPLRLIEAAISHRSPLQTLTAAQMHLDRAEKLAPPTGDSQFLKTPYNARRHELASRAADKANSLLDLAHRQDANYLATLKRKRKQNKQIG